MMCDCCGRTDVATIEADGLTVCLGCWDSERGEALVDPSVKLVDPEQEADVWADVIGDPARYLEECIAAAETHYGVKLARPGDDEADVWAGI
jgi:hypothetical protein